MNWRSGLPAWGFRPPFPAFRTDAELQFAGGGSTGKVDGTSCRFRHIYAKAITGLAAIMLCVKAPGATLPCIPAAHLFRPPSIPPEAFLRSSYISSIIGFHSRTRALMNQLDTCQCNKYALVVYVLLGREELLRSDLNEVASRLTMKHETVPDSCSGRS